VSAFNRFDAAARGRWAAIAAIGGMWLVFFASPIFSATFPFYRDNLITYVALVKYMHERLRAGQLPQWFPYESLGVPFIGQIATGLFHPATWLLLPLPVTVALKWNLLLAYLAAAAGAYRFTRYLGSSRLAALHAAAAYGFGGYLLGVSSVIFYLMGTATLPWLAWAAHRLARQRRGKDLVLFALLWALVFYSADVQAFLWCALLAPLALFIEQARPKVALLFVAAGALTTLLCCAEYLPALVVSADSVRVQGSAAASLGSHWALHPWWLPGMWIPGFLPDEVRFRITGEVFHDGSAVFATTIFAGGCVLALAGLGLSLEGRRRTTLSYLVLALLGVWLALGSHAGLLELAKKVFPLLGKFRFPVKYLELFWLGLAPLVAFGVDVARAQVKRAAIVLASVAVVTGLCASYIASQGLALQVWHWAGSALDPADPVRQVVDDAWNLGLLWTALFAALASAAIFASRTRPAFLPLLLAIAFAELWHGNGAHFPVLPNELLHEPNPFAEAVRASAEGARPPDRVVREVDVAVGLSPTGAQNREWVQGVLRSLRPDVSGFYGLSSIGENLGATSVRHEELLGFSASRAPRLGPMLDGCFRTVDARRKLFPGEQLVASAPEQGWNLLKTPCWPRAFLAGTDPVTDLAAALAELRHHPTSPDSIVWENGPKVARAQGSVRWVRSEPEQLAFDVEADRDTALIVSDLYAPGWTATVDGKEAPIHPALIAIRGLAVPAGHHRVEMSYRTPRLALGLTLSALGALACALLLALAGSRRLLPAPAQAR
jgi:hypothetical protein